MIGKCRLLLGTLVLGMTLAETGQVSARSPLPYFKGVERLAVFCSRPSEAALRDELCETARATLEGLVGRPVPVGPTLLGDRGAITVLVNGHRVDGPHGPVLAVVLDLFRRDQVDGRMVGSAPILVDAGDGVTFSNDFKIALKRALIELVTDPWHAVVPEGPPKKEG